MLGCIVLVILPPHAENGLLRNHHARSEAVEVAVDILAEVLGLNITSSGHLANIIHAAVTPSVHFDVPCGFGFDFRVDEIQRLAQCREFVIWERINLMLSLPSDYRTRSYDQVKFGVAFLCEELRQLLPLED